MPAVLVVEDNEMNQMLLVRQLQRLGITDVALASNGIEALEWLATHDCALVIADCQMPGMDGYEMTRRIRESEKATGQHLPIIAVTASAMDDDRDRCAAAGMDAHLAKPLQIAALRDLLRPWLPPEHA